MTTPVERLLRHVPDARRTKNGWSARCPAHDDQRASLSISEGDDGKALVYCHAKCKVEAICAAADLRVSDLMPSTELGPGNSVTGKRRAPKSSVTPPVRGAPRSRKAFADYLDAVTELERKYGQRSNLWKYGNADGEPAGVVVRWNLLNGGKEIRPVSRWGDGWRIGAMPEPRPLYALSDLSNATCVLVCEGEKTAEAARSLGFTATTSAGGSQAATKTDWRPLAGKEVWIVPDNDAPGRKYADAVAAILAELTPAAEVRIIELPGLPKGGDIVDWIETHGEAAEPDQMRSEIETLAKAVVPWQPGSPDSVSFRPFPLHAFPEPVRRFVDDGAKAIGCDPSYIALPLLVALAAAIGNTRRLELKRGWSVPPILWGVIVGESGTAKSPAFRLVMRPIRARQENALKAHAIVMKQYEIDRARWEKLFAAWKHDKDPDCDPPRRPETPQAMRIIVTDTTVEALAPLLSSSPRGLLMARDEMSGWFGSFDRYAGNGKSRSDSSNWLSMFDGESIVIDRKTGDPRTISVPHATVWVMGGIQPAILRRALGSEHRESGLAARLLLAYPPRTTNRWTEADIDPRAESALDRIVDRLYELEPESVNDGNSQPRTVYLAQEAKDAWRAFYNEHAVEKMGLCGDLAAAWSKLEQYGARIALVLHLVRWAANDPGLASPDIVDAKSMEAGITVTNWFKHEARRVYSMLDESDSQRDQRRLVEWIGLKGGTVTAREVQQGCRWMKEAGTAEAALDALVKQGRGRWEQSPCGRRGQPTRRFKLPAASTVYGNASLSEENANTVDVDELDDSKCEAVTNKGQASPFNGDNPVGPYSNGR